MIHNFIGEHRFLSNFAPVRVDFEGYSYPTVEHAYQSAKALDPKERACIRNAQTAGEAKRLGFEAVIRKDWESVKVSVMEDLLRQKFRQSPYREQLLKTCEEELVEGNWWNDTFWGVCRGKGQNMLGKLIMKIRAEFK